MIVRDGRIGDLHQIYYLYESLKFGGGFHGLSYTADDLRDVLFSTHHRCLVAVEGDDVLGLLLAFDHLSWGYVDIVAVRERNRRQGVGSAMMRYLEADPRSWRAIELCHHNSRALTTFCDELQYLDIPASFIWRHKEIK